MFISFKNLDLPEDYNPDPQNTKTLFSDIAYVKQKLGGFQTLESVEFNDRGHYKEYIFHDDILPIEVVIEHEKLHFLTKVLDIKNKDKYRVKNIKVITGAGDSVVRVYLDTSLHPHVDRINKYCAPPIVMRGNFSSYRFEKLRSSLYRWNLTSCYEEHIPPKEDLTLSPVFIENES